MPRLPIGVNASAAQWCECLGWTPRQLYQIFCGFPDRGTQTATLIKAHGHPVPLSTGVQRSVCVDCAIHLCGYGRPPPRDLAPKKSQTLSIRSMSGSADTRFAGLLQFPHRKQAIDILRCCQGFCSGHVVNLPISRLPHDAQTPAGHDTRPSSSTLQRSA